MRFALLTAHDQNYAELADITWNQNKKLYAEKHGYGTVVLTEGFTSVHDISWFRYRTIVKLFEENQYDWIHCCGTDTMITNFNIKLQDLVDDSAHFIIATDCFNINNDSFLVRNTPEAIAWLKLIGSLEDQYAEKHPWNCQQAMIDNIERLGSFLKVVPQRVLNAYDYDQYPGSIPHIYKSDIFGNDGQWQPGDFLIQWPGIGNDRRIPLAKAMLHQIITGE